MEAKKPIAPPIAECPVPVVPMKPDDEMLDKARACRIKKWIYYGLVILIFTIGLVIGNKVEAEFGQIIATVLPFMVVFLIAGWGSGVDAESTEEKHLQETEQYEVSLKKYNADQGTYAERRRQVDAENARVLKRYEEEIKTFQTNKENCEKQHRAMHAFLTQSLKEHYAKDIIFPKYRNLVVIATIDEYLRSGRCDTLEGPNGAYNLYEMELRQNIVIGQLSSIVRNLEQIKGNQYTLYQEMLKSNELLRTITYELVTLNSSVAINNYYAGITAMAIR